VAFRLLDTPAVDLEQSEGGLLEWRRAWMQRDAWLRVSGMNMVLHHGAEMRDQIGEAHNAQTIGGALGRLLRLRRFGRFSLDYRASAPFGSCGLESVSWNRAGAKACRRCHST